MLLILYNGKVSSFFFFFTLYEWHQVTAYFICGGGLVTWWCPALCDPWTVGHQVLCPWHFPGMNTRVGCHFLLQGIFPTQGSNPGLLHCRQTLYQLSHQGSPSRWRWILFVVMRNRLVTFLYNAFSFVYFSAPREYCVEIYPLAIWTLGLLVFRVAWYSRASLVAQRVKSLPAMQETQAQSLGWEDRLEVGIATHSVFLPGESHGQRSLAATAHGVTKSQTWLSS